MQNKYFIIRHGESEFNAKKIHQGWKSRNPLSDRGVLQAEEVAKKLASQHVQVLYASPLLRTKQTARIVAKQLGLPVKFSTTLRDFRRAKHHEGLHISEFSILPDYLLWKQTIQTDKFFNLPSGESVDKFTKRVINFAQQLDRNLHNKNIAIVTHDAVASQLIEYWIGKTVEKGSIDNAHISKVVPEMKTREFI